MTAVTHPRIAPRRLATVRSAWARALAATVEEASYGEADLRTGRRLARGGDVGAIEVAPGRVVAAVMDGDDAWTVRIEVPVFDDAEAQAQVEAVASGSGWLGTLLKGGLPEAFLEASEETGVEALPYAGDLDATCGCDGWASPCVHALAVLTQVVWLVDADPLVLLHLRGLDREQLLARLHQLSGAGDASPEGSGTDGSGTDEDLDVAQEAAERAARLLDAFERGGDVARWL